jgi:hypothetical protein
VQIIFDDEWQALNSSNPYSSLNINGIIKPRRRRSVQQVAWINNIRKSYTLLVRGPEGNSAGGAQITIQINPLKTERICFI